MMTKTMRVHIVVSNRSVRKIGMNALKGCMQDLMRKRVT